MRETIGTSSHEAEQLRYRYASQPSRTWRLLQIGASGVTLRGLDLAAFEDWMRGIVQKEQNGIRPSTVLFPLQRVEKIVLDEDLGEVPSLANTFRERIGASIDEHLE